MGVQACAELVARGDADRFRATMAAPLAAREVLFPIHAFCLEVARAPWVTREPMIAEMRLQFWRDVLEAAARGAPPRAHEVAAPLAAVLDRRAADAFDRAVTARHWDIGRAAHADEAALAAYLDDSYGRPLCEAARLLGAPDAAAPALVRLARAGALARYLVAVPALEAEGRVPLVDGRAEAIAALATGTLAALCGQGAVLSGLSRTARAPMIDALMQLPVLRQAARDPGAVGEGRLGQGPARKALRLALVSQAPAWAFRW